MKIVKFLLPAVLILWSAVFAFAQGAQLVYDPAAIERPVRSSAAEEAVIKKNALPKARRLWKDTEGCSEDFQITGAAQGSFTSKKAAQKAFLYEFCQTGNGWANNGLVIMENGRIVAHFTEGGGWNMGLRSLPDINKNGFDELVVETSGGMHQGAIGGSVTLLEVAPTAVRDFGYTLAFSSECEGDDAAVDCYRGYKITAAPGVRPVYFKEKFINIGDDEKPRWKRSGKAQKFTLSKSENKYRLLK
jgi:hypothetical protein